MSFTLRSLPPATGRWPVLWIACAMLALGGMAGWQANPTQARLLVAAVGALGAALTVASLRRPIGWGLAAVAALGVAIALAANETRKLRIIAAQYRDYSIADQERRVQRMAESVSEVADVLSRAAHDVVNDLSTRGNVSARLTLAVPVRGVESALLVFRDGALVQHVGQSRVPIAATPLDTGVQLVRTAFHTALTARATSPDQRTQVVAVALLASQPPADRFATSLAQVVAGRSNAARVVFERADSAYARAGSSMLFVMHDDKQLLAVRAFPYSEGETRVLRLQQARAQTGIPLAVAALFVLIVSWRPPATTRHRLVSLAALLGVVALAPLSALSNVSQLFNVASYYAPMGGPLTANVASLLLSATLILAALLLRLRGRALTTRRRSALLLVLVVAGLGPFILRDLARGISLPPSGVTVGLWVAWQLAIALAGVSILLAGAAAGQVALGPKRGLHPMVASSIAIVAALLAPVLWTSSGGWPDWYSLLWVIAIAALALTRGRAGALVVAATIVAGCGAVTLTWGATVRQRMQLASHDLAQISAVDDNAFRLMERFADRLSSDSASAESPGALLREYAESELAMAGYPARLARWAPGQLTAPVVELALAPVNDTIGAQATIAQMARASNVHEFRTVADGPTTYLVGAVPSADGMVTTIAVPPRTRLLPADPFAALTGIAGERGGEAPYRLTLGLPPDSAVSEGIVWQRRGSSMHGDGVAGVDERARVVHIEVDLGELDALVTRGALLVMLDVGIVLLLWTATATVEGALWRWIRLRRMRLRRSYRVRLSVALTAFFIVPAAIFATWSAYRLREDDRTARELLVRETLRNVTPNFDELSLASVADGLGAPFFLYQQAQLVAASDPVLDAIAPLGRLLPPDLHTDSEAFGADGQFASRSVNVRAHEALVGYRQLIDTRPLSVLATPATGGEFALDARREDLAMLLLFVTALGVLAAIWSSGIAARALSGPIHVLREAALELAAGKQMPVLGAPPANEFAPVYRAFGRMAEDLSASRAQLQAAQRRTEAVLQHVASGVVAFRDDATISIMNPSAQSMLAGLKANGGESSVLPPSLQQRLVAFLSGRHEEESFELQEAGRQLRVRFTRIAGGAVLTFDDVTELATAQRVLAWGEMARQVAHEIKNPLTPIRLGVQHLRRAFKDGRSDFGNILDSNVSRVLAEIDHLDEIARSFSRYGMAPEQREQPQAVNVAHVVHDVVALEQLGADTVSWVLTLPPDPDSLPPVLANADELKEVLLNLLENARLASATRVELRVLADEGAVHIEVIDNGSGIAEDVLPRIFEPHFSTRTSGSGLGLAISRRLVEGWGGGIGVTRSTSAGTTVRVTLRAATAVTD